MRGKYRRTLAIAKDMHLSSFIPLSIRNISSIATVSCFAFQLFIFSISLFLTAFFQEWLEFDFVLDDTAGSTNKGDASSPQFIVDNRAVILEFARGDSEPHGGGGNGGGGGAGAGGREIVNKNDWICDRVSSFSIFQQFSCF